MEPRFVWISDDVIVNLNLLEHVEFDGTDDAQLIFSSGEKLTLWREDAQKLKAFMEQKFSFKVGPLPKIGGRRGVIS